jgi:hypothetical protein
VSRQGGPLHHPLRRRARWPRRHYRSTHAVFEETDTSFAIDWKGLYRIEGVAFVYTDRDTGRITTVLGYPTELLAQQE